MIFYNYMDFSSFIKQDYELLKKHKKILLFCFKPKYKLCTILSFFIQIYRLIKYRNEIKIVFSQMAGHHTLIPSILSKYLGIKHIIVLHGSDSIFIKEIDYGNYRKFLLRYSIYFSLKYCDLLLPVSRILVDSEFSFFGKNHKQGFKNLYPSLSHKEYSIVPNGIDLNKFAIDSLISKKIDFLSVGGDFSDVRKNYKRLEEVALKFPYSKFLIVCTNRFKVKLVAQNVEMIESIPNSELKSIYQNSKYYLQFSLIESFGVALCEAMACGCVPIVTNVGIMAQIVSDSGGVVPDNELDSYIKVIKDTLKSDYLLLSTKAQNCIKENFELSKREKSLIHIINQYYL